MSAVTGQVLADALTRVIDKQHRAQDARDREGAYTDSHVAATLAMGVKVNTYADLISKAPRLILAGHLLGLAIAALRHGGVR